MKNPFSEFDAKPAGPKRRLPMEEILDAHSSVLEGLEEGFKQLVQDEAGDGLWQPNGDSIARVYDEACVVVQQLSYEAGDIEAFALKAFGSDDPDYYLMGPLGLYLSCLINFWPDQHISLSFKGQDLRLPLLGYRMDKRRSITVDGNLGDLIGISATGGSLRVNGNVGRYLGAGMMDGHIEVAGDSGRFVGEQMTGGSIRVSGRLGGLGRPEGGTIYHRRRCVYPSSQAGVNESAG